MRVYVASVLAALSIALAAPGAAVAESLAISLAAFAADSVFVETQMSSAGYRESAEAGCEYAPVQLPHGVTLDSMVFWVRDQIAGAGNDLTVRVWEKNTLLDTPAVVVLEGASAGSSSTIHAVIGLPPGGAHNVNTAHETFYLEACYGAADLELHHVRIEYTGPPAGIDTGSPHVVPAAAFRSPSGRPALLAANEGFLWASLLNGGPPFDCMVAPVHLPHGVRIESLEAILYDDRAESEVQIQLRRKRLNNNQAGQLIAAVVTSGATAGVQQLTTSNVSHEIVHHAFEYFLYTSSPCLATESSQRIYAVRIHHTPSLFADGFESGDTSAWSSTTTLGGGARTLQLPAAAFRPARTGSFYTQHEVDVTQGLLELDGAGCSVAPVTLPDGSTLVLLTANLYDTDPSRSLTVRLWRKRANLPSATEIGSVTSSGATGPTIEIDLLSGTVNTQQNHYYVEACRPAGAGPDTFGVQAVRIDYVAP